jgi:hypothetical protein
MDNLENFVSQYTEDAKQICLLDLQNQEESIKLQSDLSLIQIEYQKEQQLRHHFEKQFNEANKLIEMVNFSSYSKISDEHFRIIQNVYKN